MPTPCTASRRVLRSLCLPLLALTPLALACASGLPGGMEPLGVQVVDVEPIAGGGRFEQRVRVTLRLQNPNDAPVTLDGMRFALAVNDQTLTRAVSTEVVEVPRLGEREVKLEASTTLLDVVRQLAGLRAGADFDYALDGTLFVTAPHDTKMKIEHAGRLMPERDL